MMRCQGDARDVEARRIEKSRRMRSKESSEFRSERKKYVF